jgi:hypothetical protein
MNELRNLAQDVLTSGVELRSVVAQTCGTKIVDNNWQSFLDRDAIAEPETRAHPRIQKVPSLFMIWLPRINRLCG